MAQPVHINRSSYLSPATRREIKYVTLLRGAVTQLHENPMLDLSIADLVRTTTISKRTIYKFFPKKDRLIAEAIHLDFMQWESWFFDTLYSRISSPPQGLRLFCELVSEWNHSEDFTGCLFARAFFSNNQLASATAEAARNCTDKFTERLTGLMKAAKKKPRHQLSRLFITTALTALTTLPPSHPDGASGNLSALLRHLPAAVPVKGRS